MSDTRNTIYPISTSLHNNGKNERIHSVANAIKVFKCTQVLLKKHNRNDNRDINKQVVSCISLFFSKEYVTHKNILAISHVPQKYDPDPCINIVDMVNKTSIHVK